MSTDSSQHTHPIGHSHDHEHAHAPGPSHSRPLQASSSPKPSRSVLAWPAWLRVVAVLPLVLGLWLAVWWANAGVSPW